MNVRIGSVQIAERFTETMGNGLENKPLMGTAQIFLSRDRKTELKWHVESRRCRKTAAVDLDP